MYSMKTEYVCVIILQKYPTWYHSCRCDYCPLVNIKCEYIL